MLTAVLLVLVETRTVMVYAIIGKPQLAWTLNLTGIVSQAKLYGPPVRLHMNTNIPVTQRVLPHVIRIFTWNMTTWRTINQLHRLLPISKMLFPLYQIPT